MIRLSVNLNKVALLRNSRHTGVPDPARGEAVVAFLVLRGPAGETALRALVPRTPGADRVTGGQTLTAARLPSSAQIVIV